MEEQYPEEIHEKNKDNTPENDKLDRYLAACIVGIIFLMVIYLSIGIFKYPASFGKTVLSFNNRDRFDFTHLELIINSTPILTWPFNGVDSIEVKRNVEEVFNKAAFIEKASMSKGIDSTSVYSSFLKLINDESKNHPLTFPIVNKIMYKNRLSFSNDSLFLREIVNRCKNDAEVQFFCDNIIGTIQYLIITYSSDEKDRKWHGDFLEYFSNKYIDFLSSIFMDYTGNEAQKNDDKNFAETVKKDAEAASLNDIAEDVVEIVDSVKQIKGATASIVENSIQVYKNISGSIKKRGENVESDSILDSTASEKSIREGSDYSNIQDVQSLDLPKP